jgi:sterol desaturase/sphingolipid hydroxylase (fatty acid hydroxylase superfamily)
MWYGEFSKPEIWVYATVIFMGRYLLIAGAFYAVFYRLWKNYFTDRKIQRKFPGRRQVGEEIKYSLITFAIYGSGIWLFLYWIENGITKRYEAIDTYGMPYFVLSILIMIVLHDTYFYWTHRCIHQPVLFGHVHSTHHRFKTPTPWAAFAFHPFETIVSMGIIPLIIFIIPFHQWAVIAFITFMITYNVVIHLGFDVRGLKFIRIQNTTLDHDYHHNKGHSNYGLYFNIWDKLMGTYRHSGNRKGFSTAK